MMIPKAKYIVLQSALFLTVLFTTLTQNSYAQLDTAFWFAPPRTVLGHNPGPIELTFTTGNVANTTVTISKPADPGFTPITLNMVANDIEIVSTDGAQLNIDDLYPYNGTNPADTMPGQVTNYGLYITSTSNVQVYYQSSATSNNPDIYSLKGTNALGTEFTIPSQSLWHNAPRTAWGGAVLTGNNTYVDDPKNTVDIVATEDGTVVTYTPSATISDGMGGVITAGTLTTVTLDRGQTYRLKAVSQEAAGHLGGTTISSSAPIAVTISDDTVDPYQENCGDNIGDQLIPESVLGKEYIIMKGWADIDQNGTLIDYVFVQPIEDNTTVVVTDASGIQTTQTGVNVLGGYNFEVSDNQVHVAADKPVYVLHVSGNGCELGGAVLPPIDGCTGSLEVGFVRSNTYDGYNAGTESFGLNIFVRTGAEDAFDVEGGAFLIDENDFTVVEGTDGEWTAMHVVYDITQVPMEENIRITNSESRFHLGMINGERTNGGTRYGYLSSFANISLDGASDQCSAEPIQLDGGVGDSYVWQDGNDVTIGTSRYLDVTVTGDYFLTVTFEGCELKEEARVVITTPPVVDLSNGFDPCVRPIVFNAGLDPTASNFTWSTGETTASITPESGGTYTVIVSNDDGCEVTDEITIPNFGNLPVGNISDDCTEEPVTLDAWDGTSYQWSDSAGNVVSTAQSYLVTTSGMYYLTVTDDAGCEIVDSADVTIVVPPEFELSGTIDTCRSPLEFEANIDATFQSYLWSTGETTANIVAEEGTTYGITVTTSEGCTISDEMTTPVATAPTITLDWYAHANCEGVDFGIDVDTDVPVSDITWTLGDQTSTDQEAILLTAYDQTVELTISATAVCETTETFDIEIGSLSDSLVISAMNVFTPNADNINDVYGLDPEDQFVNCATMIIYDRWGRIVHDGRDETPGTDAAKWDGMNKKDKKEAPGGTYYVIYEVVDQDGNVVGEAKHTVTLMRGK